MSQIDGFFCHELNELNELFSQRASLEKNVYELVRLFHLRLFLIALLDLVRFGGMGLGGMEENKKSGGEDVRAEALSWDDEGDKV